MHSRGWPSKHPRPRSTCWAASSSASAVPAFIERATAAAHAIVPGAPIIVVAHLGDGNVHFIPLIGFDQWRALDDADATSHAIKHAVNVVAHELGGTFSAEHGIGQVL